MRRIVFSFVTIGSLVAAVCAGCGSSDDAAPACKDFISLGGPEGTCMYKCQPDGTLKKAFCSDAGSDSGASD